MDNNNNSFKEIIENYYKKKFNNIIKIIRTHSIPEDHVKKEYRYKKYTVHDFQKKLYLDFLHLPLIDRKLINYLYTTDNYYYLKIRYNLFYHKQFAVNGINFIQQKNFSRFFINSTNKNLRNFNYKIFIDNYVKKYDINIIVIEITVILNKEHKTFLRKLFREIPGTFYISMVKENNIDFIKQNILNNFYIINVYEKYINCFNLAIKDNDLIHETKNVNIDNNNFNNNYIPKKILLLNKENEDNYDEEKYEIEDIEDIEEIEEMEEEKEIENKDKDKNKPEIKNSFLYDGKYNITMYFNFSQYDDDGNSMVIKKNKILYLYNELLYNFIIGLIPRK
jgi:hypothetical protein